MKGLRSLFASRSIPAAPLPAEHEPSEPQESEYERKLRREQNHFGGVANIHDLPPIFHYWSNKYIRPMVEEFGFTLAEELYAKYLALTVKTGVRETPIFLSVGAGDGETEIKVAQLLRKAGILKLRYRVSGRESSFAAAWAGPGRQGRLGRSPVFCGSRF
jgi:hypothetical protein